MNKGVPCTYTSIYLSSTKPTPHGRTTAPHSRRMEQRPKYRFLGPYAVVRCSYLPRTPSATRHSKHQRDILV
ncbi:hypothetical protein KQX54_019864 [Cotesia glomerata]|uniref:Uncharacterized protein n=1 Tax=Cotesia glomerata TaxID=32391 RepID=A0AAV7JA68_COTGL|nr:hypothetical protein KQX54_019864 [Cotesia glomerata]